MLRRLGDTWWFHLVVGVAVSALALVALVYPRAPAVLHWLTAVVLVLAVAWPLVPLVVLLGLYVDSRRRGLVPRVVGERRVAVEGDDVTVVLASKRRRLRLVEVARARCARDDGPSASGVWEDALTLFAASGVALARVLLSAGGVDALRARSAAIGEVWVSAPSWLD